MFSERLSNLIDPSRSRLVAALALAALATVPAQAGAASPDASKPPASPASAAAAATQAPDRAVRVAAASPAATKALSAIQQRIAQYVARRGANYSFGSYLDSATGRIVLSTDAPGSLVSQLTNMSDPAQKAAVSQAEVRPAPINDAFHRRDDIPSFWGGAGITKSTGGLCSSGYAVRNSAGTVFSVTAGHCFANGTNVLVESGLRSYGTVSGRRLPTVTGHPMDMELVGGQSYSGRVYSGGVTSTSSRPVAAAGAASVGFNAYCHSGRTTGERCGHTATSTNAQVCTATGCKQPVIAFTGGTMIQGGDSGGAFYAIDGAGKVWIRGNVIATNGSTGWAQPYTTVASQYGVSIVTG